MLAAVFRLMMQSERG
ncbi:hypothetical protein [Rhodococcus sp. WMMA185]|nr:hypothetical protein [Rhodococcus sp. WMMA185]